MSAIIDAWYKLCNHGNKQGFCCPILAWDPYSLVIYCRAIGRRKVSGKGIIVHQQADCLADADSNGWTVFLSIAKHPKIYCTFLRPPNKRCVPYPNRFPATVISWLNGKLYHSRCNLRTKLLTKGRGRSSDEMFKGRFVIFYFTTFHR